MNPNFRRINMTYVNMSCTLLTAVERKVSTSRRPHWLTNTCTLTNAHTVVRALRQPPECAAKLSHLRRNKNAKVDCSWLNAKIGYCSPLVCEANDQLQNSINNSVCGISKPVLRRCQTVSGQQILHFTGWRWVSSLPSTRRALRAKFVQCYFRYISLPFSRLSMWRWQRSAFNGRSTEWAFHGHDSKRGRRYDRSQDLCWDSCGVFSIIYKSILFFILFFISFNCRPDVDILWAARERKRKFQTEEHEKVIHSTFHRRAGWWFSGANLKVVRTASGCESTDRCMAFNWFGRFLKVVRRGVWRAWCHSGTVSVSVF
jgi:hypothetical protein